MIRQARNYKVRDRDRRLRQVCLLVLFLLLLTSSTACSEREATATRLPPHIYDDEQLDRFWKDARHILGDRLGYISEGDVREEEQVVHVGVVDMSDADRKELEEAAPNWVDLDAFETKYSIRELKLFAKRAVGVLEAAGLGEFFTGMEMDRDVVYILATDDLPVIRETIESVIPADAYRIEISQGGEI